MPERLPILTRFANAASMVLKGSWLGANFNRIPVIDGDANEKLHQPFKNSVWVQRALKKIAGPISAVSLKFRDPATKEEITDAPWLAFWKSPAKGMSFCDLIEAMVGWLKIEGEDFIILPVDFRKPFPEVANGWTQFQLARPGDMTAEKDGDTLIGWRMSDGRGQQVMLPLERVIQPKYWNPYDPVRGLSEYESARVASEADYLSGKFALHIAQNNGDQGVIIAAKGGSPTEEQIQQITAQLREKRRRQQRGEFVPAFLSGDVEVKDPKISSVDAAFIAARLENRHEIFAAFGVPMSMADVTQSYSIGSASDRYLLIEETCIPTGAKIAEPLGLVASIHAGRPVEAYFDWDEHPVMQQVRRERIDTAIKLADKGMPMATASEYLDLDLPRYPGDDTGYLPFSVAPVDAPQPPKPNDQEFAEAEEGEGYERAIRNLKGLMRTRRPSKSVRSEPAMPKLFELCCCPIHGKADAPTQTGRPVKEVGHWRSLMAQRLPTIRAYESKIGRVLYDARAEVLRKLEAHSKSATVVPRGMKSAAGDFLFDLADFTAKFQTAMRTVGMQALHTAGQQFFGEIKRDDPFTMPPQGALDFLDARANKLSDVPDEIFDQVKRSLQEGLNGGESLKELSDRVRGEFNSIEKGRATTVAMTETAAAYGTARHEAMKQAGITHKRWLTSGNGNVRASHRAVNGAVVPIDGEFLVLNPKTGETDRVQHPGDPDGAPWNVINCHCVSLASSDPENSHGGDEE